MLCLKTTKMQPVFFNGMTSCTSTTLQVRPIPGVVRQHKMESMGVGVRQLKVVLIESEK